MKKVNVSFANIVNIIYLPHYGSLSMQNDFLTNKIIVYKEYILLKMVGLLYTNK